MPLLMGGRLDRAQRFRQTFDIRDNIAGGRYFGWKSFRHEMILHIDDDQGAPDKGAQDAPTQIGLHLCYDCLVDATD